MVAWPKTEMVEISAKPVGIFFFWWTFEWRWARIYIIDMVPTKWHHTKPNRAFLKTLSLLLNFTLICLQKIMKCSYVRNGWGLIQLAVPSFSISSAVIFFHVDIHRYFIYFTQSEGWEYFVNCQAATTRVVPVHQSVYISVLFTSVCSIKLKMAFICLGEPMYTLPHLWSFPNIWNGSKFGLTGHVVSKGSLWRFEMVPGLVWLAMSSQKEAHWALPLYMPLFSRQLMFCVWLCAYKLISIPHLVSCKLLLMVT